MRWLLGVVVSVLLAISADAAVVQARLVLASNDSRKADKRLSDIESKLKETFGYQFYQQLGAQQRPLKAGDKLRLDLGQEFVLFILPKSADRHQQELELEWYSGKTLLVRSVVKIVENGHLFVKGPEVGNDWIVLAVGVRN